MRWLPQERAVPALGAASFGLTFACAWWQTLAPLLVLAPVLCYVLSDSVAGWRRPEFCVYLLRSEGGEALYVGSTNDVERRALEHTSPAHHEPWRTRIHSITVLRWCHTQRQSLRIERRMIRALTVATENGWCARLHNETYAAPPSGLRRLWAWVWSVIYLCQSCLWAHCCWHRPPQQSWAYVIPRGDRFDEESWDEDEPFDDYEPAPSGPVTGNASAAGAVTLKTRLPDYVREPLPNRYIDAEPDPTDTEGEEPKRRRSPLAHLTPEERADRERAKTAERVRAYRARKKAEGS